ncbi:DNA-binding protein MNB1B-like [Musa acuminata AAA Group]|uniref:DNA-binding protein MNB1B-like n=1 Tax=Musa acuminata AAA Group TaxID=214697 RepID=UPI0031D25D63
MGRGSSRSNPSRPRKRVEAETASTPRMRGPSPDVLLQQSLREKAVEAKKPTEKKRVASSESKEKKAKKGKKSKDLSAPKRPPTAKGLVSKEGDEKWKAMSDELSEKKPYIERAVELKIGKALEKHNQEDDGEEKKGSYREEEEIEKENEE